MTIKREACNFGVGLVLAPPIYCNINNSQAEFPQIGAMKTWNYV